MYYIDVRFISRVLFCPYSCRNNVFFVTKILKTTNQDPKKNKIFGILNQDFLEIFEWVIFM